MDVAIGGVEVRLVDRHETPMNLQLLRGRDLRPPSRRERPIPAAVSETPIQTNISPNPIEAPARKKALRFPVNRDTRGLLSPLLPRHDDRRMERLALANARPHSDAE